MLKWKEQNGKIIANRAWIMTEAWRVLKRCKAAGIDRSLGEAMKNAWWDANMEVSVQNSVRASSNHIKELAALGYDRLRDMANDIENIDRHSASDRNRLADIRSAMHYA